MTPVATKSNPAFFLAASSAAVAPGCVCLQG